MQRYMQGMTMTVMENYRTSQMSSNQNVQQAVDTEQKEKRRKKPVFKLKHRMSNFELNKGLHKQASSQLKIENDYRIGKMMSKPDVWPSPRYGELARKQAPSPENQDVHNEFAGNTL